MGGDCSNETESLELMDLVRLKLAIIFFKLFQIFHPVNSAYPYLDFCLFMFRSKFK